MNPPASEAVSKISAWDAEAAPVRWNSITAVSLRFAKRHASAAVCVRKSVLTMRYLMMKIVMPISIIRVVLDVDAALECVILMRSTMQIIMPILF